MPCIKRRAFITLLGGAAAWPLAASAQQGVRRLAVLMQYTEDNAEVQRWLAAFDDGLQQARLGRGPQPPYRPPVGWNRYEYAPEPRKGDRRNQARSHLFVELADDADSQAGDQHHPDRVRQSRSIPLARASWRAWRDRAETSPVCRTRHATLPASDLNSCARSFPICAGWQF
jgi:hypothetical protein